jgi:glycosyltransferase involved in cell wall biosynthesis
MTDIAFFLMDLNGGGAEKVMLSLANGFAKQGLEVDLVLVKLEGEYLTSISPKVRTIDLKSHRLIAGLPQLIKYLRKNRPKVMISALEDPNTIAIIAKVLARVSTRTIVTVHNHLSRECMQSNHLKRKLTPLFIRWLFPLADKVVSVSQGVADDAARLSGLNPEHIQVIYNPIFSPDLLEKFKTPVNHHWFDDRQPPVILGVGRLTKQKDFATLIRAFALVRRQYSVKLMILGQGEELPALEALVKELNLVNAVTFAGFVANPYAYMSKAKMLVMTSIFEGFGNVLVEGMVAGISVVSTDCESGPSEILANGKYGMLAAVGDVQGLATAMINTLNNPLDPEILKKRGQEFSLEAALTKYQRLFNNVR